MEIFEMYVNKIKTNGKFLSDRDMKANIFE